MYINPIIFSDKSYNSINVGNKIILTENTANDLNIVHSGYYDDDEYCPEDFVIPKQEDYQELINKLGSKAYSVLTDKNGFESMIPRSTAYSSSCLSMSEKLPY